MNSLKTIALVGLFVLFGAQAVWAEGNLTVELVEDSLIVIGDREDNSVLVSEFDGQIMIAGMEQEDWIPYFPWMSPSANHFLTLGSGAGSQVNGGDEPLFFDASQVSNVLLVTGGGIDRVLVRGNVSAYLSIDTGAGDDQIWTYIDVPSSAEGLELNTGLGEDYAFIGEFSTTGSIWLSSGNDADQISLSRVNVGGSLELNTGAQNDNLFLDYLNVLGDAWIRTGQGDDNVLSILLNSTISLSGAGLFEGGQGFDVLDVVIEIDDPTQLSIIGFESP